jgi:hypothetical protein
MYFGFGFAFCLGVLVGVLCALACVAFGVRIGEWDKDTKAERRRPVGRFDDPQLPDPLRDAIAHARESREGAGFDGDDAA